MFNFFTILNNTLSKYGRRDRMVVAFPATCAISAYLY